MRIVGWRLRSWSFEKKNSVAPDGVLKKIYVTYCNVLITLQREARLCSLC